MFHLARFYKWDYNTILKTDSSVCRDMFMRAAQYEKEENKSKYPNTKNSYKP
jgi:hypothetical protein